jgi:competence protein ComEC
METARQIGIVPVWAAEHLVASAGLVRAAPWAAWRVPPPPLAVLIGYYAAGVVLVSRSVWPRIVCRNAATWTAAAATGWMTAALWIGAAPSCATAHPGRLRALSIDVGQGDATLLELPDGHTLLIDAGGLGGASTFDIGERVVVPTIWASGLRRIDYLLVTHGDADHAGGAPSVVTLLRPREVWEGIPVSGHPLLTALHETTARANAAWRQLQSADEVEVGGAEIRVLNPRRPEWERRRVRNADSVVLDVRYGDVSFLLMGDADESVEPSIGAELRHARVRVLKVGHHGSRSSSLPAFISAAHPTIAVISCGRHNRFGHPAAEVLRRFEAADVRVFRTDQEGAIAIETDGRSVWIETFTGQRAVFALPPPRASSHHPKTTRKGWWLEAAVMRWLERTQATLGVRGP